MLGIEAYIQYLNQTDKTVLKALEVLEKGESFPKAPEETVEIKVNDEGNKKETAQADSTGKKPSHRHRVEQRIPMLCLTSWNNIRFSLQQDGMLYTHWVMKYRRMIL